MAKQFNLRLIQIRMVHISDDLRGTRYPGDGVFLFASVNASLTINASIAINGCFFPYHHNGTGRADAFT
jgi:hypothetical protein